MKDTKTIQKEVYVCDCCNVEFEEAIGVMGTMYGEICGSYGVVFEPKVFGDYCEDCMKLVQNNWNKFGRAGICHDRYDTQITDKELEEEIQVVKDMRDNYLFEED